MAHLIGFDEKTTAARVWTRISHSSHACYFCCCHLLV